MNERQSIEVERVLLHVGDARMRARKAADALAKDGADSHVVDAVRDAERDLAELHRTLAQRTYYAVPESGAR